jgi:hypothetical protein
MTWIALGVMLLPLAFLGFAILGLADAHRLADQLSRS